MKLRVEIAQAVLEEYASYVPLTVRQIYYRAVGAHGRPKTKQEYDNFLYAIAKARRAELISMDAIRDDGETTFVPQAFEDVDDFREDLAIAVERYRRRRQDGQATYLEVHCEAAGMVDQLAQVAAPYGVPVYSGGGQTSLTTKYNSAMRAANRDVPTEILFLGDADHHGRIISDNVIEDTAAFVADHRPDVPLAGTLVALTEEQIAEHDLPQAPDGKPGYQLEALAPDVIAEILRAEIINRIDTEMYQAVLVQEQSDRDELREWLS